jgi:hypothetical protein
MNLSVASGSLGHALSDMVANDVLIKLVGLFAVSAMMIGLSGRILHTILGFVVGLAILVLGGQFVVWLSTLAGSDTFTGGHVLANLGRNVLPLLRARAPSCFWCSLRAVSPACNIVGGKGAMLANCPALDAAICNS